MGWFSLRRKNAAVALEPTYAGYTLFQVVERVMKSGGMYDDIEMLRSWWFANVDNQAEFDKWMEGKDGYI